MLKKTSVSSMLQVNNNNNSDNNSNLYLHDSKLYICFDSVRQTIRGVYMRKLAPARVSYRDDFLISYRVYIMTGSFHISLFEGTLHVDKIHV